MYSQEGGGTSPSWWWVHGSEWDHASGGWTTSGFWPQILHLDPATHFSLQKSVLFACLDHSTSMKALLTLLLPLGVFCSIRIDDDLAAVKKSPYYDGEKTTLPISTEAGLSLYQHWLDQALSGLMAAVATQRFDNLTPKQKKRLEACSKKAKDPHAHAKCVAPILTVSPTPRKANDSIIISDELKKHIHPIKSRKLMKKSKAKSFVSSFVQRKSRRSRGLKKNIVVDKSWVGGFRMRAKREIVQQDAYELLQQHHDHSPFGIVARHLTNLVRSFKGKEGDADWRKTLAEVKAEVEERKERQRVKKLLREQYGRLTRGNSLDGRRPLFSADDIMDDIEEVREKEATKKSKQDQLMMKAPMRLIREGVKLAMMASGKNVDSFHNKTLRLLSPKFMALTKEEDNTVSLISPSILSMHDEGEGVEKMTSLSSALEKLPNGDQRAWMDFVIEASGVSDAVDKARKKAKQQEEEETMRAFRGPNGQPLYFTKENVTRMYGPEAARKVEIHEKLDKMYTKEQMIDFKSSGYSMLTPEQVDLIYGPGSPHHNPALVSRFKNLTRQQVDAEIANHIRQLSHDANAFKLRQKDIVLSPVVLTAFINNPAAVSQAAVLSPLLFAPLIQSPAIFGSVILSPWVFVPIILSPRLLSPVILSPFLFSPLVLSPLAFDPVFVSAGLGNPFILCPLVLSPFVLSPQALTPLILCPFALTPFILNPTVLSPVVLSPFVLSPSIMSPAFFSAVWLSPYALSPSVESNGAEVSVFLSPSWMS